mgnify:CR=1 FL=1
MQSVPDFFVYEPDPPVEAADAVPNPSMVQLQSGIRVIHDSLRGVAEAQSQELNDFELLATAAGVFPSAVDTRVEEFPALVVPPVELRSPALIAMLDGCSDSVQGAAMELASPCAEGL